MTNSSSAWPDSRAFVFMLRDLERQRRYVRPYQLPTPQTSPPPTSEHTDSGSPQPAPASASPATGHDHVRVGRWTLHEDDDGDLVFRHDEGRTHVFPKDATPEDGSLS